MANVATALWLPELERQVHQYLNGESSGHDPWHAFRVRDIAVFIARRTGADLDVVHAASLLHDIGHAAGRKEHATRGASFAVRLLTMCSFPADKISAVNLCIQQHHWLPGRAGDPTDPTLEYQAFADGDRLDALGAIGIARTFAFGGAHGRPIWNPEPNATAASEYGISSIHHFYDKLLRLPGDMYTEPGRCLAAGRVAIMEGFLRLFYLQWDSKDLDDCAGSAASLSSFSQ